eukprot:GGOE01000932.1.p1 GENE.GGOE01000932.1~~GGOE01000932.1.p1  ORF type:complete len:692 (+),score=161.22 GGOE01000932.1:92-2077(+)
MSTHADQERWNFTRTAKQITDCLADVKRSYNTALDAIAAAPRLCDFDSTFGAFARAEGSAAAVAAQLSLPALVAVDPAARAASSAAKEELRGLFTAAHSRVDVYEVLAAVQEEPPTPQAARLKAKVLSAFQRSGCGLPNELRRRVAELSAEEGRISGLFEQHLNEDVSTVSLELGEMEGISKSLLDSLPPDPKDPSRLLLGLKAPKRTPFLQQATNPRARQHVLAAADMVGMDHNAPLLERLVQVRHERASLLGFPSHAHFRLAEAMAGNPEAVQTFLHNMADRLEQLLNSDLNALKALKAADGQAAGIPAGGPLEAWDVQFYGERLRKQKYGVDQEALRKWFPLSHVRDAMFHVYESMLGLSFRSIPADDAPTGLLWHPEVEFFAVTDTRDGHLVGHFLLDLFSRPGKFGHQCVVALAPCLGLSAPEDRPVCAMLGNLSAPTATSPSLLRPMEVETLFHEFGHVMHALCTAVPYSRLSWTWPMMPWPGGVEQDFLEVPSMALQHFVYDAAVVRRLASPKPASEVGDSDDRLDDDTVRRLSQTRYASAGLLYRLWHAVMSDVSGILQVQGTFLPASWYHPVIGYDAGYYGYLWAEVVAADILHQFELQGNLLDPDLGRKFRSTILEPCAAQSGAEMARSFLGREPDESAFFKLLGMTSDTC